MKTYAKIHIPVYDRILHICVGDEQFTKLCQKHKIPEKWSRTNRDGAVIDHPEVGIILFVGDTRTPDTLVHECVHVASFILDTAGVPVTARDDEALAYLTGYVWKEVVSKVGVV